MQRQSGFRQLDSSRGFRQLDGSRSFVTSMSVGVSSLTGDPLKDAFFFAGNDLEVLVAVDKVEVLFHVETKIGKNRRLRHFRQHPHTSSSQDEKRRLLVLEPIRKSRNFLKDPGG